jgi:hypothetical protein
MTKENLSDLKSALQDVLKNSVKREEVVIEQKKEEKPKVENYSENHNSGPKEIPEQELKKILGID